MKHESSSSHLREEEEAGRGRKRGWGDGGKDTICMVGLWPMEERFLGRTREKKKGGG